MPALVARFELEDEGIDGGDRRESARVAVDVGAPPPPLAQPPPPPPLPLAAPAPATTKHADDLNEDDDHHHHHRRHHYSLEQALDLVGAGLYQRLALLTTGLANAADAAEILAIGLVVPAARGDLELDAHPAAAAALTSLIFLGMMLGGLAFGPLGDRIGRRPTLALSLALNGACGALSSLAPSASILAAVRFVAGVGVGGSVPVVFAWMSETVPRASRGRYLVLVAAFWMVGSLFSATMGLLIIPRLGWRPFLLAATFPAWASAACAVFLMDESPRHSLVAGRPDLAVRTLRRMARMNGRPLPPRFALAPLQQQQPPHPHPQQQQQAAPPPPLGGAAQASASSTRGRGGGGTDGAIARLLQASRAAAEPFAQLLRPPLRAQTLPLLLGMAGISGGWYSLILWLPSYFEKRGARVDTNLYVQTLAVSLANLPGNLASVLLIDRLGRRLTACWAMALAGLSALAFALAPPTPAFSLAAACVFNGVSMVAWNALDCMSAELFPTAVRASGVGLLGAAGRMASFAATAAAGWLTEASLAAPLVVAAALLAGGSAATLRLPEPAMQPLEDSVGEAAMAAAAAAAVAAGAGRAGGVEMGGRRERGGIGAGGAAGAGGGAGGGAGAREEEGEGASLLRGGGGAGKTLAPLSSSALMR